MKTYWRTSKGRIVEEVCRDTKRGSVWCLVIDCETGHESQHRLSTLTPSLGPSNDVGVEVEIRAAELEAGYRSGLGNDSDDESLGYMSHHYGEDRPQANNAGWLARQIWMHDEDVTVNGFDDMTQILDGIDQSEPVPVPEAELVDSEHTQPMAPLVDIGGES